MSEFTKEDLIEIQADHCQPLYYQLLAAFAVRQMERAENAEAMNDKLGKSLSAAMEALGEKQVQLTEVEAERDRLRADLADALDLQAGHGPTALASVVTERDRLREKVNNLREALVTAYKLVEEIRRARERAT